MELDEHAATPPRRLARLLCVLAVAAVAVTSGCGPDDDSGTGADGGDRTASSPAVTDANPDDYLIRDGKHAFRLGTGTGKCSFNFGNDPGPNMFCNLALPTTDPPITDPVTGIVAPANAVSIETAGARLALDVSGGGDLTGVRVLPAGYRLVVGELSCTAISATALTCAGPTGSFAFDGTTATIPAPTASATSPTATAKSARGPGSLCGKSGADNVIVNRGQLDCDAAVAVVTEYRDPATAKGGQSSHATVDGWQCTTPTFARSNTNGYLISCTRGAEEILVKDPTKPILGNVVDADYDYEIVPTGSSSHYYYFRTPASTFRCAIVLSNLATTRDTTAGCHGGAESGLPADTPVVPGNHSGASPRKANTIGFDTGSAASFYNAGDPRYIDTERPETKPLAVGDTLFVQNVWCTVTDAESVNCTDGTHGFAISPRSSRLN